MPQPLMQAAKRSQPGFQKPDISQFIPPEAKDAVDRIVAAGMKIMYSPQLRQELQKAVQSKEPVPQKMAAAVTTLLVGMDKQSKGSMPTAAMFPAGMELLGEAAMVLEKAGQPVTQEDYNDAAQLMFVLLGKAKFGAKDQDMMGAAQGWVGGAGGPEEGAEGEMEPEQGGEPMEPGQQPGQPMPQPGAQAPMGEDDEPIR